MPRRAPHADDEIPARRGAGVFHQVADNLHTVVARGFVTEGRRGAGQRQIVVNRLGHMRDLDLAAAAFRHMAGGKRRVVAADADERGDAELFEHGENVLHLLFGLGRVRARGAENGAALEMDVLHVADGQRFDLRGVAGGDVLEAVAETDDFVTLIDAFNRGRRNDAVQARSRPAADQNSQSAFAHVKCPWLLVENENNGGWVSLGKNSIPFLSKSNHTLPE